MASRTLDSNGHTELFARAMKVFSNGDYRKARSLFEDASDGPVMSISESARMYMRMCDQRLTRNKVEISTPEEHYHYAIKLINERRLDEALAHLKSAQPAKSMGGHVLYAMALALGLRGDYASAYQHLKQAIEFDPQIKMQARLDADFRDLLQDAAVRELVYPERAGTA